MVFRTVDGFRVSDGRDGGTIPDKVLSSLNSRGVDAVNACLRLALGELEAGAEPVVRNGKEFVID